MSVLRVLVVIGAIVGACYFGFRKSLESEPPQADAVQAVVDSETLLAAEKFTRDWFDGHSGMPRDEAVAQFMQDAYVWVIAYRVQHGLPTLTSRQRDALRDKLCARVRCEG